MVFREFVVFMLGSLAANAADYTAAMKTMSQSFGKMLYTCQQEMMFSDDIIYDFLHFWEPDYPLTKKDVGCAVICVSKKLHLLDANDDFLIPNAGGFSKASGADDEMAKELVELVGGCRNASAAGDGCRKALEVANCFRAGVQQRQWVPQVTDDEIDATAVGLKLDLNIR